MLKKTLSVIIVVVWCALIFNYSNQNGTSSKGKSDLVVNYISDILKIKEENRDKLTFPVRKCAHFFVYFILGFLVANMFKTFNVKLSTILIITCVFCMFYAIGDEIHQFFIQNRQARVSDVLLDTSASIFGTYLYFLLVRGRNEKNN